MPNEIVIQLLKDVAALKAQVEGLITYQRWQMGALAAILAAVIGAWLSR